MKVRSVGSDGEGRATHLYIDGNPSKFLQGHSVIGPDDLQGLVLTTYARILALLHIPHDLPSYRQVMEGQFKISRIDINYMYSLSTLENVRAWLYAAEFKAKTRHGRACGKGGTVYLGKNSRRWSLKFYSKYDEHTSGKKGHQMADEFVKAGLLDWSKDKLRIELTLRTTELIDLNLTLGNSWNIETPNKLFSDYVGRIEMNQNTILTDEKIINLPRKIQSTYLLWKQGANIKEMLPKPTFYRHRKELLSFGIDINFYCESPYSNNVVPLVRTIEAKPAKIPSWVYEKGLIFDYVAYLSDILGGYVSGSFNNSEAVISDDSLKGSSRASNYINRIGDILVYYGTKEDIAILKTLVTSLDTMSDEVVVSGYVFEVQTSQSDGSGILLAAKILSDKFNISVGAAGLDNFINIRTGSIDAIFNLLKTDSRFTVVSAPRLRVKNNASESFSVGSDVPVLGSVTVNNNTTTQSVEYRSSGVLFNVTPSIKSRTMDLKIQQQLSNFVTTETGVNNSPTLIKRDVTTEVSLADGDIILLGGLAEQKDSKASSGWSFFGSRTSESNKTDIMVMLQVRKVDRSRATPRSAARSGELFRDNLNSYSFHFQRYG
ncbi:TPA: hypothetical protein MIS02_06565 [Klebsiella pneumoniae]|nr:hypothetical protein [Klebsiella pneumoniae]HBY2307819.1 hypothetical protein [Klebsiella pneumoniae]HBY2319650.1 hypothetical protein [Klebsiella pneumoniae]HBY2325452.1 hypothetical protein [Klebsiella pneumoniae]